MPPTVPLEVVAPKSAIIKVARVTLTHAQLLALNVTPITFSDSPGTNRIILPLQMCLIAGCAAGAYGTNPVINISLGGVNLVGFAAGLTIAQNRVSAQIGAFPSNLFATVQGQPLKIGAAAAITGGNAANTLKCVVPYIIAEFP